jgi:hypothetical protein
VNPSAPSRPRALVAVAALASLAAVFFGAASAAACEVCYGGTANGSPLVTGARLGVFLLLGVTVTVLGGFAKFFFYLRRCARRAESDAVDSEWAQLQRSSST